MLKNIARPLGSSPTVDQVAHEATAALFRRRDSYPTHVGNGKLDGDWAAADIAAWQAIADDAEWVASPVGETGARGTRDTLQARTAAIDTAIERYLVIVDPDRATDEQKLQSACLAYMRLAVEAERRYYVGELPFEDTPHFTAMVNHKIRDPLAIGTGLPVPAADAGEADPAHHERKAA